MTESETNFTQDEVEVEYAPVSAVVGGEWYVRGYPKHWINSRVRNVTDDHQSGFTSIDPFGKETVLAFPLVETPTIPQPEGTLTVEQYEKVMKTVIDLNRRLIAYSSQPINLSEF